MTLIEQYEQLLIKQYYDQANARSEVVMKAGQIVAVKEFLDALANSFDLDNAVDDRLDKIGKLVGLNRTIGFSSVKSFFGFNAINHNARGFNQAPFASKFSPIYSDTQLDNYRYRQLIKSKIALNVMRGVMAAENDSVSLQSVIELVFGGQGVVIDNQDMSLTLYLPYAYPSDSLRLVVAAGLVPRTQGVEYRNIISAESGSFGFSVNSNSSGFASKFNTNYNGGKFARKIIL